MYVDDMTLEEAREWEAHLVREIANEYHHNPRYEQLVWDHEDVCRRIQELDPTEGTQ